MTRLINIKMPESSETMLLHLMGREYATLESLAQVIWLSECNYPLCLRSRLAVRMTRLRAIIRPKGWTIVSHGRLGWKLERIGG